MLSEGLNNTEIKREAEVEYPVQNQWFFVFNIVEIHLSLLSIPFFAAKVDNIFGLSFQVRGRGKLGGQTKRNGVGQGCQWEDVLCLKFTDLNYGKRLRDIASFEFLSWQFPIKSKTADTKAMQSSSN